MSALEIARRYPEGQQVLHQSGWTGVVTCASTLDDLAQGHVALLNGAVPIVHVSRQHGERIANGWFLPYVLSVPDESPAATPVPPVKTRGKRGGRNH